MNMPTTELDDLKAAWQMMNRKLERQHALALHQFKESKMARFRSGFQPLVAGQVIQLVLGAILAAICARFAVQHLLTPHLLVYGASLQAYGLMLALFAVRDLVLISRIDYDAPVIIIQKQIAALRAWHLRAGLWFAVGGCFMWTPLLLVIFYAAGADLWLVKPQMVYWNVLSSFVCLGASYGLVLWSRRPGQEKLAKHLSDSSVGRSVARAQALLEEIEQFERE